VRLAKAGRRVAVIERHRFGGNVCQYRLHSDEDPGGQRAHGLRGAARGGLRRGDPLAGDGDMAAVKARKDRVAGESEKGVESWLKGTPNCTVIQGHARFVSNHEVPRGR